MKQINDFCYQEYTGLWFHERIAIDDYMNGETDALAILIQEDRIKSSGLRKFIADVISGKMKRRPGQRKTTFKRDYEIYYRVLNLLDSGYNLTSSKDNDGAALVAGKLFDVDEEVAIKAYQRIKKQWDEHDNASIASMADWAYIYRLRREQDKEKELIELAASFQDKIKHIIQNGK